MSDADRVARMLRRNGAQAGRILAEELERVAISAVDENRRKTPVDTGWLRNRWRVNRTAVENTARYAGFARNGQVKRDALDITEQTLKQALPQTAKKIKG